jgi:arsenite methyltransferase
MRPALCELLVDPDDGSPLRLETTLEQDGDVVEGRLVAASGATYPVRGAIPRFVGDEGQTGASFGYKWKRRGSWGSASMQRSNADWIAAKYGFGAPEEMRRYFGSRRLVLDAGCGGGFTTSHWMTPGWTDGSAVWVGLDLSAGIDVARERLHACGSTEFVQGDVLRLPFEDETFDTAFAEGVLHHTPSTRDALASLARVVSRGGDILFYVYRRKGPVREFVDDYVRERVSSLPPEEAWEALRPLTRLGEALARSGGEVEVEEDVPLLGIERGSYPVQRLVYWHVAKLFWNDDYSFEENHHVNFDWYHPRFAHRQTEEDLRAWCDELALEIAHFDAQESGFTVRARRR